MEKRFVTQFVFIGFLLIVAGLLTSYRIGTDTFPLGNDLAGGATLVYRLDPTEVKDQISKLTKLIKRYREEGDKEQVKKLNDELFTLQQMLETGATRARDIIQRRVDPSGTTGVKVRILGGEGAQQRVEVLMPKATSAELRRIRDRVEKTGNLRFHRVLFEQENSDVYRELDSLINQELLSEDSPYNVTSTDSKTRLKAYSLLSKDLRAVERLLTDKLRKNILDSEKAALLDKYEIKLILTEPTEFETGQVRGILIESLPAMQGSSIRRAGWQVGEQGPQVDITFDSTGAAQFGDLTLEMVGKRMAIVLDGRCYSAPNIREPILQGQCRISGGFLPDEADRLAQVLQTGSLPMTPELISMSLTGPTLGREAIRRGMIAIIIAGLAVLLFMFVYYRTAGMVANLALIFNLILLMGLMCFLNAHMTLPGIAGILLTVGMSVDANVLIFERIREEHARGRTIRMAIEHGFNRALVTILDANITTFLTGVILYYFGIGPVKGFATTLMLGIITSLFCALFITRTFIEWISLNTEKSKAFGPVIFTAALLVIVGLFKLFGKSSVDEGVVLGISEHIAWGATLIASGLLFPGLLLLLPVAKRVDAIPPLMSVMGGLLFAAAIVTRTRTSEVFYGYLAAGVLAVMLLIALVFYMLKRIGIKQVEMSTLFVLNRKFDFMGVRGKFIAMSATVVAVMLVVFGLSYQKLKGIEFTSGTQLIFTLKPDKEYRIDEMRSKFNAPADSIHSRVLARSRQVLAHFEAVLAKIDAAPPIEKYTEKKESIPALSESIVYAKGHYTIDELSLAFSLSDTNILQAIFPKEDVSVSRLRALLKEMRREVETTLQKESFSIVSYGAAGENRYKVTNRIQDPILGTLFRQEIEREFSNDLIDPPTRFDLSSSTGYIALAYGTTKDFSDDMFKGLIVHVMKTVAESLAAEKGGSGPRRRLLEAIDSIKIFPERPDPSDPAKGVGRVLSISPLPPWPADDHYGVWNRITAELEKIDDTRDRAPEAVLSLKLDDSKEDVRKFTVADLKNRFLVVRGLEPIPAAQKISSDISGVLQVSAGVSIVLALIVIFIYIFLRFDFSWAYGAGAVIALFHDVSITLGMIAVAHWVFGGMLLSLDTVAAILTIVGYSLNDTIVVFDRIRELRRAQRTRPIPELVNDSINQCLSRTLLTSITTLLAVGILLVLGGQDLRPLSYALFIGVIVGTYSSIFIASPVVVFFIDKSSKKKEEKVSTLGKILTQQ